MNDELFEKYFLGELDPAEAARLKELLTVDASVRAAFAAFSMERAMLVRSAGKLAALRKAAVEPAVAFPDLRGSGNVGPHGRASRKSPFAVRNLAALAASLLIVAAAAAVLHELLWPPAGRVTSVTGAVRVVYNTRIVAAKPGQRLATGSVIETEESGSLAEVLLRDGSRIRLSEKGRMEVNRRDGQSVLVVDDGFFEADFAKQPEGRPLLIKTRQSCVQILGTRIQIVASPDQTKLDVLEGKVLVTRLADGTASVVPAGQTVAVGVQKASLVLRPIYHQDRFQGGCLGSHGMMKGTGVLRGDGHGDELSESR